jgi:hypothetical protein
MYNLIKLVDGVWTVVSEFPDWESASRALTVEKVDTPNVCLVLADGDIQLI